ncbi:MAG TPA: c-type cytochrome domain-containing protein, partial [Vicinamibacterales bacterium]|nr:c-type cytochrome domain-containing protein [Vicinamibacterales bacterium]
MNGLPQFIGRFHPLLVHLPIGILLLAGVLEIAAWIRRSRGRRAASSPDALGQGTNAILVLGAAAAIAAAVPGYLLGTTGGYAGPTYDWHVRLGTLVAIGATLTAVAGMRRRAHTFWRRAYAVLLPATITLLVAAGHLGATLAHGEGYLTDYAPPALRPLLGGRTPPPQGADADARVAPETIVVYTTFVEPVLRARCGSCHGPNRAEGGLRLDSHEAILKGGNSGPVIVPGRADDSDLVRRVFLPPAHEDVMPPKGRRPPAPAEAALLRWWVDQGASADRTLADAEISPEILPIVEAVVGPLPEGPVLPRVEVPAAVPDAIDAARRAGFSVAPVAEGVAFLRVHCTNHPQACDDARLRMLERLAAQVLWLDLGGTA